MRPLLTYLVPLYWMAAFAMLASQASSDLSGAEFSMAAGTGAFSLDSGFEVARSVSTAFAIAFGLVATLFLWALLTAVLGPGEFPGAYEEVVSVAFAGAVLLVTVAMVTSAVYASASGQGESAFQLAALAASYVAVIAERRSVSAVAASSPEDPRAAARQMALGAAHSSMLNRLVRRSGADGGAD